MKEHKWSRRAFYLAAAVAIVASTSGFALASVLSAPTQVNQGANFYQGGNVGANGYTTATLGISDTPSGVVACTSSISTGASIVNITVPGAANGTCKAGDWAMVFTLPFSATITSQTNEFTVYSQLTPGGPTATDWANLTLTAGGVPHSATIYVYVDYGSPLPPAGIASLDLIVH